MDWHKIQDFLDNPGERWVKAYNRLNPSEQTLLLSLLDAGGEEQVETVRQIYNKRIAELGGRTLTWSECLKRLTHSFVSVTTSYHSKEYVDFQHPSLRDMILSYLSDAPIARRRYIELASPTAISNVIQGMAPVSKDPRGGQRFALVQESEELTLLVGRIRAICAQPLPVSDWHSLLAAAELLIPREPIAGPSGERKKRAHAARAGRQPLLSPAELGIDKFGESPAGTVLRAVVEAFARRTTFAQNRRYSLSSWMSLIWMYYRLAPYVPRPIHPEFVVDLVKQIPHVDADDGILYATRIRQFHPLLITQRISPQQLKDWDAHISHTLDELIVQGKDLAARGEALEARFRDDEEESYYDSDADLASEYDSWRSSVSDALELADFYGWSRFECPEEEFEELRGLLDSVYVPEPDWGPRQARQYAKRHYDSWTIDEMFADL